MRQTKTITMTLLPALTALLWGFAFAFQRIGAGYVGPCTFLACRSWAAVLCLLPVMRASDRLCRRRGAPSGAPKTNAERRHLWISGILCGSVMMAGSALQQMGIAHTTSARASFLTALYVLLVPLLSIPLGKRPEKKLWLCVLLSLAGLYLLCLRPGSTAGLNYGDFLELGCALLFAVQILLVDRCVSRVDPIRLTLVQMLTQAVLSLVVMLSAEHPDTGSLLNALPSILYAGILSSAVGYTLQSIAQRHLSPAIVSLTLCLESVFGALGGWLILGQTLSGREILGCALMFLSIVLAQLPLPAAPQAGKQPASGSLRAAGCSVSSYLTRRC